MLRIYHQESTRWVFFLVVLALGAPAHAGTGAACEAGFAGVYPCSGIDWVDLLPLSVFGSTTTNDVAGWVDPLDGKEYALVGLNNGTGFVRLESTPTFLGVLPTHTQSSIWRALAVFGNHLFVVSEAPHHGMQIFDLTQLRGAGSPPATFVESSHYSGFAGAHSISVDQESAFAYVAGSSECSGGLLMLAVSAPLNPVFEGCFSQDGYSHSAECVVYRGADREYHGHEICFSLNEDTLTIVDVSDKTDPFQVARFSYSGVGYTAFAALDRFHRHLVTSDELDELNSTHGTRTYVWDLADLDAAGGPTIYESGLRVVDGDLVAVGDRIYQANSEGGLRVLDGSDLSDGSAELAYFDTWPASDGLSFEGARAVYAFQSPTILIADSSTGLFVLSNTFDVIFLDAFESGDASNWSSVTH